MRMLAITSAALLSALRFWTAGYVTRPLRRMTLAAEGIARGEPVDKLRELRADEVGDLSRSLTSMATRLQERLELLAEERNKLVAVLSGMVEGVLAIDREERVLHLNRAAAQMLELPAGENLAGRSLAEVTRFPPVGNALHHALRTGESRRGEVLPEVDGSGRVLELTASALRSASGEVNGAVLVLHDVTELRHLETVRRDFVANVSHELKTPLAALRGILETLEEDHEMPAELRRDFVERAGRQTARLAAIVADLLSLSRLERREPVQSEELELRELTRDSIAHFEGGERCPTGPHPFGLRRPGPGRGRRAGDLSPDRRQPPQQRRSLQP